MKRIASLISAALMVMTMTGCEVLELGGYEVDWYPVNLYLKVQDAKGTDLLDPENPDNTIDGTTITFKGNTYEASRQWYESGGRYEYPETKAYLAQLFGLRLIEDSMVWRNGHEGFSLEFGEIDGARDMDEDLVVTLPNGKTETIHYHCSNHNERKGTCDRKWKFNGKKTDSNIFIITID